MERPPCWGEGVACPNDCAAQQCQRVVANIVPLHEDWAGWRMAGRCLVSPDGDRIRPDRLRGVLWREYGRKHVPQSTVYMN